MYPYVYNSHTQQFSYYSINLIRGIHIHMRKYLLHVFIIALVSICLGGCTSSSSTFLVFNPNKILPVYVNPLPYEQYDCSQIGTETESVTRQLYQLHLDVKKKRKIDSKVQLWGMAGAMVLGVPGVLAAEHGYKSAKYNDGDEEMRWGRKG